MHRVTLTKFLNYMPLTIFLDQNGTIFYFTPGNSRQNKALPLETLHKIFLHTFEVLKPKTKTPGNST